MNIADIKADEKFDNRYRLIRKIGGGGFSEVWLAHDTNADIDVALKIYTPNGELDDEGKENFKKEFARLCGLNHTNIIHAIGFGIHNEELPYLAMSVCKDGSAKKLIGNFDEEQLWTFIEQVTSGLQYLHSHDITHQDIKPDNILVNSDGQYLIIDFGISTRTRNTLRKSEKGSAGGGTTWYMSNESFGTESSDIHARDIWAFGATLYEIVTGDVPFGQYGGVAQKAQDGKIPAITANVSDELKQLIYDCLALNAWDRPDADTILERVRAHKDGHVVKKDAKPYYRVMYAVASVFLIVLGLYVGYSYVGAEDSDEKGLAATENQNDSAFLAKMNEAITITQGELAKNDLSAVDEQALCSAAVIVADAKLLEASDSVKMQGNKMWATSQELIDNTYEYLYNKGVEYGKIDADSASSRFERRSALLVNYVSQSKVKKSEPEIEEKSRPVTKQTKSRKEPKEPTSMPEPMHILKEESPVLNEARPTEVTNDISSEI